MNSVDRVPGVTKPVPGPARLGGLSIALWRHGWWSVMALVLLCAGAIASSPSPSPSPAEPDDQLLGPDVFQFMNPPTAPVSPSTSVGALHSQAPSHGASGGHEHPRAFTSQDSPRVLVLCSYDAAAQSSRQQRNAIVRVILQEYPLAQISTDYTAVLSDERLHNTERLRVAMAEALRAKWQSERFDLLVTTDTLAYDLVTHEASDVFANTPVVFSGVMWSPEQARAAHANSTGAVESLDLQGTVGLLKDLMPRLSEVLIVCHGSAFAEHVRPTLEAQVPALPGGVRVRWATAIDEASLVREVSGLQEEAAVVFVSLDKTANGSAWRIPVDVNGLSRPVGVLYATRINGTVLGGSVVCYERAATAAGRMATRVLAGAEPRDIPIQSNGVHVLKVNAPGLERWGLNETALPAGAFVVNATPGWLDRNRQLMPLLVAACVLQGVAIGAIVLFSWRARLARRRSEYGERWNRTIVDALGEGIIVLRADGTVECVNARACEIFGVPSDSSLPLPKMFERFAFVNATGERVTVDDCPLNRAFKEQAPVNNVIAGFERAGERVWALFNGRPVEPARDLVNPIVALASVGEITDIKTTRERLERSEHLYRTTVDAMVEGVVMQSAEGLICAANKQALDTLGLTFDELRGRASDDARWSVVSEDGSALPCSDHPINQARVLNRSFRDVVIGVHRPDGEFRWLSVNASPAELDGPGRPRGAICTFIDITERREAQQALRREHALFDGGPVVAIRWREAPGWPVEFASENLRGLGFEPSDLTSGRVRWMDMVHPDDRVRVYEELSVVRTENLFPVEQQYRVRRQDGSIRHIRDYTTVVRDEHGQIRSYNGYLMDVTDQAAASARLEEVQGRATLIFQHAMSAMVVTDSEGRYLDANPAACELLGASREQLLQKRVADLGSVPSDDAPGAVFEACRQSNGQAGRLAFVDFSGTRRVVEYSAHPLPGGTHLSIFRDATDTLQAETLQHEQKRILEMLAGPTPLVEAMDEVIRALERLAPGVLGSVLLLAEDGRAVETVCAPSLPETYNAKLLGFVIGPRAGSCGTAMYRNERVVVTDIECDPLWADYRQLVRGVGLRACWSEPIRLPDGRVVGSFAMYYREPKSPNAYELSLISSCAHLVGLAIQRDLAERALHREHALFSRGPAMAVRWSREPGWPVLEVSENIRQLGYEPDDVRGGRIRWADFIHPDDVQRVVTEIAEFRAKGQDHHSPQRYRVRAADGSYRQVLDITVTSRNERGEIVSIDGYLLDMTEHEHTREMLETSERRARDLLEGVNAIFWEADPRANRFVFVAGRVQAILGYTPEEMLVPGFWPAMVHPEDRDGAVEFCRFETLAGRAHEFEYRALRKDGSIVWIRDQVSVQMESGVPVRLAGVLLDVSESKSIEAALRASEERYRQTFHSSRAVQMLVDPTTRAYVDVNDAACEAYGYTREQFLKLKMEDINVDSSSLIAGRLRTVEAGPRNFEIRHRTASGEVRDVEVFATPIDVRGRRLVCAIVHDVTERRRAERRQQLMIAELDHRVKNNLATIMSLADQTGRSTRSFQDFNQAFVGRLRALARMHAVLASNQWSGASLDSILRQTLAAFAAKDCEYAIQGRDVFVAPREAQSLALVLHELATNAAKYGAFSIAGGAINVQWTVCDVHERTHATELAHSPAHDHHQAAVTEPEPSTSQTRSTCASPVRFALQVRLSWQERGGPPTEAPTRTGFGLELVQGMLAHELGGRADFQFSTSGLRGELVFGLQGHAWESAATSDPTGHRPVVVNGVRSQAGKDR